MTKSKQKNNLVSVIIVNYNSDKFIEACLESLEKQEHDPVEVILLDNQSQDNSPTIVKEKYPWVQLYRSKKNLGFAAGNNLAAKKAKGEYLLFLNQDIVIEPDFISKQVKILESNSRIAITQGKLLKYDFDKKEKKSIVDCAGIKAFRNRRMIDIGQGLEDNPRYNKEGEMFAGTGAALFCRVSALEEVAPDNEIFDENFWAYKEDIDLCWRLRLFDWICYYVPTAVGYHGRTSNKTIEHNWRAFVENERKKPWYVRELSPRNHYLMMLKNETWGSLAPDLPSLIKREIQIFGYVLFFAPRLLKTYFSFISKMPNTLQKRKFIQKNRKIKPREIRKWFNA